MAAAIPCLVQVGQTALRAADGSFLPAVPLYILADGSKLKNGLTEGESQTAREFGQIVAGMQQISKITNRKGEKNESLSL